MYFIRLIITIIFYHNFTTTKNNRTWIQILKIMIFQLSCLYNYYLISLILDWRFVFTPDCALKNILVFSIHVENSPKFVSIIDYVKRLRTAAEHDFITDLVIRSFASNTFLWVLLFFRIVFQTRLYLLCPSLDQRI